MYPPQLGGSNILLQPMETVRLRRQDAMATSSPRESTTAMLARIEAEITTATNRGIRCKKWGITHEAQISWAMQKLYEAKNERDTMRTTIEELSKQVKQLSARLEKGELQLKSLDKICTFRAADLRNQLPDLQELKNNQCSMTSPTPTTPEPTPHSPVILQSAHPDDVGEGGETLLPRPAAVHPPPDVLRPSSPDIVGLRDFCKMNVQARSSPIPDAPAGANDPRNTSNTSSNGEATTLRKILIRNLEALEKIIGLSVDNGTEVEKLKNLHNCVIPRVEKMVHDIESDHQKYSRVADIVELDEVTNQVDPIIEEASNFVATVTSLYDDNEGYAPTLSWLEKAMAFDTVQDTSSD